MSNGGSLNWIVPFRRAVVTNDLSYTEAMRAWHEELRAQRDTLHYWYLRGGEGSIEDVLRPDASPGGAFDLGHLALERWISTLPGGASHSGGSGHSVSLAEAGGGGARSTIYTDMTRFYPRLWKGPLRVVWEELGGEDPPAQIYSRGMVYGAFARMSQIWDGDHWKLYTTNWGPSSAGSTNYPADDSESQRNGLPVTPGWACWSSVLWLYYLLLDVRTSYRYVGRPEDAGRLWKQLVNNHEILNKYLTVAYTIRSESGGGRVSIQIRNTPWPSINLHRPLPREERRREEREDEELREMGSDRREPTFLNNDIVIVSYDSAPNRGHNIAFMKLRDPRQRASEARFLDDPGFLTAYNPLTGQGLTSSERGEYFMLSAGGSLNPRGGACRSNYLTFAPAPDRKDSVFTVAGVDMAHFRDRHQNGQAPFPAILVCNDAGILHDREALMRSYQERAVPFPTMREAHHDLRFRAFGGGEAASVAGPGSPTATVEFNGNKEIENTAFRFITGDVLEFPLHKFIAACGIGGYDGLEFDPEGSFLLGNTVRSNSGSGGSDRGSSPPLHDNIIGMRFQLLLNLGKGAFVSHDRVGTPRSPGALSWMRPSRGSRR